MLLKYKFLSKVYDLMDFLFFNNKEKCPRHVVARDISGNSQNVLDVCCGTGTGSILIKRNSPDTSITGIDNSAEMISVANRNINKSGVGHIKSMVMDASSLEFEDSSFDSVIISLVLHELGFVKSQMILKECRRVLREDGNIYVIEWKRPNNFIQKILFSLIILMEGRHFKHFLKTNFDSYFKKSGLKITGIEDCSYTAVYKLKNEILVRG